MLERPKAKIGARIVNCQGLEPSTRENSQMKPAYTGQRSVPSTDHKFRPTDEHLLEKDKEELDQVKHGDKMAPIPGQHRDKFADVDRKPAKKE